MTKFHPLTWKAKAIRPEAPPSAPPEKPTPSLHKELLKSLASAVLNGIALAALGATFVFLWGMKIQKSQLSIVRNEIENEVIMLRAICARTPETEAGLAQLVGTFADALAGKHAIWKTDRQVTLRELTAQVGSYTKSVDAGDRFMLLGAASALQLVLYEVTASAGTRLPHDRLEDLKKAVELFSTRYESTSGDPYKIKVFAQFDYSGG